MKQPPLPSLSKPLLGSWAAPWSPPALGTRSDLRGVGPDGDRSRRDAALDRGADVVGGMIQWRPFSTKPKDAGLFVTRAKIEPNAFSRRVLFTGNFWMADAPVAAWRPPVAGSAFERNHRPVSSIASAVPGALKTPSALEGAAQSELVPVGQSPKKQRSASSFEELSLVPMGDSSVEIQSLRQISRLELKVDVVKFSRPSVDARGISSGRVLAVSENYSAQGVGKDQVVIHENANLNRGVAPGEDVTMAYENGRAQVFDGLTHDVNITADWMPKEQQAYLRMTMLDALSMMRAPEAIDEDEKIRDAMRFALESTSNFFGVEMTRLRAADISLAVNERVAVIPKASPEHAESMGAGDKTPPQPITSEPVRALSKRKP